MLKEIREFFWPLLEGEVKTSKITLEQILNDLGNENNENTERLIEFSKEIYEAEEKRKSSVESKATTLLGATGLTTMLIANFGKSMFFDIKNFEEYNKISVFIFCIFFITAMIYFSRSIFFALKTLGRAGYHKLDPKELIENFKNEKNNYEKRIAASILAKTIKNYSVINSKVDWMVLSQEYFKRGIFTIIIVAIILSLKIFLPILFEYILAIIPCTKTYNIIFVIF